MSAYLRPTAPIAESALLPGDPGRALALAQELLTSPLMSNHNRGLWGYSGETAAGTALTIQSTGIGGPSLVAVSEQLAELGVRRAVRVGNCRADLEPGTLVVAEAALGMDGVSAALGAEGAVAGDGALTKELVRGDFEVVAGTVVSVDLMEAEGGLPDGAIAVDLATAPLFAFGRRLGLAVGAVLVVSESMDGVPADDELVEEGALSAGRLATAALGQRPVVDAIDP